jgi:hypothetical protein
VAESTRCSGSASGRFARLLEVRPGRGELAVAEAPVGLGAELRRHDRADRGDRQQPGHAGDRVVDAGRDPRVVACGGLQDRGGQRRDRHRQPQAEQQRRGQHVRQVGAALVDAREPQQTGPADDRPGGHQQTRPDARRQRAETARQRDQQQRDRQQRNAGLEGAVAGDLLQEDGDKERGGAEPGVGRQRHDVADGEVARAKDRQRQHRVGGAALVGHERGERADPADQRRPDAPIRPAQQRLLDERIRRAGEAEHAQHGSRDVDAVAAVAGALGARRAR